VKEMNRKVLVIAVALMAVAMIALPISAVSATKPMPVSGTFTMFPGVISENNAGNSDNSIWTFEDLPVIFDGGIIGTGSYDGRWVVHNYDDPLALWVNSKGHYEIEATVDGKSGTLYIEAGSNSGHPTTLKPAKWRIIGGTGELANLHGQGTFIGETIFLYVYTGQVHFDP
jgi:hypothetical protein